MCIRDRENVANLESAVNELSEAQIHNVDRLEAELASLRTELGTVRSGGPAPSPNANPKLSLNSRGLRS